MTEKKSGYKIDLNDIEYSPENNSLILKFPAIILKKMYDQLIACTLDGTLIEKQKNTPEGLELCFQADYLGVCTAYMPLRVLQDARFIALYGSFCRDGWPTEEDNLKDLQHSILCKY